MKWATITIGGILGFGGLGIAAWSLAQTTSVEMQVALVGLGATAAAIGISNILSVISTREAENADQRFDAIEKRLDYIEASISEMSNRSLPKGWVRALFYESPNEPIRGRSVGGRSYAARHDRGRTNPPTR